MRKQRFNCPGELTVSLIGGKWRLIILYNLRRGPLRFGELRRRSPGITAATLTTQLRQLEHAKLIRQSWIGKERTAGVEYSLTESGESLRPLWVALIRWGIAHRDDYVIGEFGMKDFTGRSRP